MYSRTVSSGGYMFIYFAVAILITINLVSSGTYGNGGTAFRYASFQTATIITTTGYATTDFELWPNFSKVLLFFLSVHRRLFRVDAEAV